MSGKARIRIFIILLIGCMSISALPCSAQKNKEKKHKKTESVQSIIELKPSFNVQQGIRKEIEPVYVMPDSVILSVTESKIDSLAAHAALRGITRDSLLTLYSSMQTDSLTFKDSPDSDIMELARQADSLNTIYINTYNKLFPETTEITTDTTYTDKTPEIEQPKTDSSSHKKSLVIKPNLVRDSIPLSKLTIISAVVPGFAQIYEGNYWKAAVGYTAMGVPLALSFKQNKEYKEYKKQYDQLVMHGASREELDPVHSNMIKHNTYRQLLWAGTALSYMALLADGVVNYPSELTSVKKATTLSMIFPGAGQFYNKSYWKIPFVVGAFASMAYIVDWNNRGYKRYQLAYNMVSDGDDSTVDEFNGRYSASFLKNIKDQYRRNRDLAIIGLAGVYLLNVIDAHVDAHLKDFDVSDDLTLNISPEFSTYGSISSGINNTVGLNINLTF